MAVRDFKVKKKHENKTMNKTEKSLSQLKGNCDAGRETTRGEIENTLSYTP